MPKPLTKEERDFVEQVALLHQQTGMSRSAGLVIAFLIVCDPPYQSAQAVQEAVDVSAGSVSECFRSLEAVGFIERVPVPGERARFYQLAKEAWTIGLGQQIARMERTVELTERGLELYPPDDFRAVRIQAMRDYFGYALEALTSVRERWRARVEKDE